MLLQVNTFILTQRAATVLMRHRCRLVPERGVERRVLVEQLLHAVGRLKAEGAGSLPPGGKKAKRGTSLLWSTRFRARGKGGGRTARAW
jgi:hypothetical protein